MTNPIIVTSAVSWVMAQVTKAIVTLVKYRGKKRLRDIVEIIVWRTGGMPSSHAATVCSMTAAVALYEGFGSVLFAVSFFLTMVVMRDSLGVRRSAGHQAKALNELGRAVSERLDLDYQEVQEIDGHTPLEVVLGGLFGILVAVLYAFL